jgi:ADP-ribosylglycohydrolase
LTIDEIKAKVKAHVEQEHGYDLSRTLDEIRPSYRFNESCRETVPQAIIAFLESTDFEAAIRNAISLGGDSDTLAAITGSIAEAAYGIPNDIADKALSCLDAPLRDVYERWRAYCKWYTPLADNRLPRFHALRANRPKPRHRRVASTYSGEPE